MSDLTSSAININVVRLRYKLGIYQIIRLKLPLGVLRFINRGNIADFSQTEEIIIIFLIFLSLKYFGVKKYIKKNGNFIIFYCSEVLRQSYSKDMRTFLRKGVESWIWSVVLQQRVTKYWHIYFTNWRI